MRRALVLAIVAIAETGHEPVDNPDTHLELTMVHEGMLLEASGRRLAILMYAAELKFVVVAGLFMAAFLPAVTIDQVRPEVIAFATLVALAIGAVMPGCAISQARATCAGVARWSAATSSSACRMRSPRGVRYLPMAPARAGLLPMSAAPRYLPDRKPLASA